jgi:transglutaminase-like putative cysteine protease
VTLLFSLLFLPAALPDSPGYVLEIAEVGRIEAKLNCEIHCDRLHAREWILFAARAPELPGQTNVESQFKPDGHNANELSFLRRPIFTARLPALRQKRDNRVSFSVTYEATLRSRTLRPLSAGESQPSVRKLSEKERGAGLLERGLYDFSKPEFQRWLRSQNLQRGRGETEIDFAFRVFEVLRSSTTYDYEPAMDRHASAVCRSKRSDCGGLSIVFVSALRANGIPARALFGRWAQSDRPGETSLNPSSSLRGRRNKGEGEYHQAHVKSEFFAERVGWIPVDVSQAVLHARGEGRSRYFGEDPGDFLTLHIDPDLELDTIHFGRRTAPNLQGPVFWVTGQGSAEATHTEEEWRVRKLIDTRSGKSEIRSQNDQ